MGRVTLKQLEYFVALAEDLHFGRAAARLRMSQPPLSQQIKKLERAVGHELLTRKPRVELTPAGEAFLVEVRRSLAQIDHTVEAARRAGTGETGHITVGFAASATVSPLPDVIRACRQKLPDIRLSLQELHTIEQVEALRSGDIDVGFLRAPYPDESLVVEGELREPFLVVLPEAHELASRSELPLDALAAEPFVLFPRSVAPGLYDQVVGICAAAGFAPRVLQEAHEWLTIVALVECGLGVSLIPASFRRLKWGRVVYRDLRPPPAPTNLVMCRALLGPTPAVERFLDIAKGSFGSPAA